MVPPSYICASGFFTPLRTVPMQEALPNPDLLLELVRTRMPFGKYKDKLLCDLPVSYLEWFGREGFPKGKLGMLLQTVYEIKINGLGDLLERLKRM